MRRLLLGFLSMAAAATLAACRGVQPMLAPGGPQAHSIARLGWFILITFSAVTVIMWVLIFWVAARRRGTLAEHAPYDAPSDKRWMIIGGFLVPTIILCTIFVLTLNTMKAFPMGDNEMHAGPPTITITGHQWWWEIEYHIGPDVSAHVLDANELHIPAGQPIDIRLRTHDVIHSFWVPRLHGKVDMMPGYDNRIRIQADQPGWYRGECGEYCGPQHAHMILLVDVQPKAEFDAWLAQARQPAAAPASAEAARGEQVFMTSACVLCHTIRGTGARGNVGPDLTHIGSRRGLAANTYPNSRGFIDGWVTHAQTMKPDSQMPNITAFTGDELRALVTYLEGLK
jgi:cytochrome c oxidase subunit 2